jgi:hypothetical protein
LFKEESDALTSRRSKPLSLYRVALAIGALLLLSIAWIGWPYYAFYKLATAFRAGDVPALESAVVWDSVRQGLRSDLNAAILQNLSTDTNNRNDEPGSVLGTGLATVLAPAIINQLVEGYVTPQAIAAIRHSEDSAPKKKMADSPTNFTQTIQSVGSVNWKQVEYMFFSGDPFTFKVQIRPEHDPPLQNSFTLILSWSGRWRLTRIVPPSDAFNSLAAATKQNAADLKQNNNAPKIAPTQLAETNNDSAISDKKRDYLKNLEIYDFKARYYETYLENRTPGVEFKIKNNGTETLEMVKVTVYFKDAQGNTIAEENYTPVLVSSFSLSDNKPLKPNYIWQLERGKFYTAKSVPSEWKEGAAEIRITDLRFEGESKRN